jgi:hypothetical protein
LPWAALRLVVSIVDDITGGHKTEACRSYIPSVASYAMGAGGSFSGVKANVNKS